MLDREIGNIKQNYLVVIKPKLLNEVYTDKPIGVWGLRLLTFAISQVDILKPEICQCPVSRFFDIFGSLNPNISDVRSTLKNLGETVFTIQFKDKDTQRETLFRLFETYNLESDKSGQYFKIQIAPEARFLFAKGLMDCFSYDISNIVPLTTYFQIRMFELLKQHEIEGKLIVPLKTLKRLLNIKQDAYANFSSFEKRVLAPTCGAINNLTNIRTFWMFDAENGNIEFQIGNNLQFLGHDNTEENIFEEDPEDEDAQLVKFEAECHRPRNPMEERIYIISDIVDGEFTDAELEEMISKLFRIRPDYDVIPHVDLFMEFYRRMKSRDSRKKIQNSFAYMITLMDNEILKIEDPNAYYEKAERYKLDSFYQNPHYVY